MSLSSALLELADRYIFLTNLTCRLFYYLAEGDGLRPATALGFYVRGAEHLLPRSLYADW
ncbi:MULTISPECIES: hypothetical protein [unclassified Microcoleus]|uniref:hypothetical protein n=1 Tax=unclassified Microcoleus TaxID=2642155 RepID=UPI001DB15A60|nr:MULTISPECIES: hypothetical protein [unclassified Microcoleus]MCC3438615.1 hypothetical protein [Microcoleus sp. PH2017_05_CCC_O_A]MCC3587567.1 hypothetical protein [Microcoleus sp. PH2017_30_WIL_O_A]